MDLDHDSGIDPTTATVIVAVDDLESKRDDCGEAAGSASSKTGKSKISKASSQSTMFGLNKFTSHIKKPPHRKASPIHWFPRKKVDSYLNRKIKMLQEVDGLNLTLDETLGDSNPHYSKLLKEKMAAREAAHKAVEARKAALVETSWCRILRAARIQCKEAEEQLLRAEKTATEAFEEAAARGVIMYDTPNCPQKTYKCSGDGSATHTVTASFETEFDVHKEVAAAVKIALIRLANCSSFRTDEFKELLRKISQNPDDVDTLDSSGHSSECESENGFELDDTTSQKVDLNPHNLDCEIQVLKMSHKERRRQSFEKVTKIVNLMYERLVHLREDELSSLATIVATCGLNAALAEVESGKLHDAGSLLNLPRRMSSVGSGTYFTKNLHAGRKQVESGLPSLDKFLVKHMTKLEREVLEAKNSRKNESKGVSSENSEVPLHGNNKSTNENFPYSGSVQDESGSDLQSSELENESKGVSSENSEVPLHGNNKSADENFPYSCSVQDERFDSDLQSSELEKEVKDTKVKIDDSNKLQARQKFVGRKEVSVVPSLDKYLVKHVSRLEKEVQEAKNRRKLELQEGIRVTKSKKINDPPASEDSSLKNSNHIYDTDQEEKENVNMGKCSLKMGRRDMEDSLDKILVQPVHRLEREKMQALAESNYQNQRQNRKQVENSSADCQSLDEILVKHVSRLEKEKMRCSSIDKPESTKRSKKNMHSTNEGGGGGGLDEIMVKHKSRLEREKLVASQESENQNKNFVSRREARERDLQAAWGGLSLGDSIRPHQSKLEQDKAAWIKAEEEERKQVMNQV